MRKSNRNADEEAKQQEAADVAAGTAWLAIAMHLCITRFALCTQDAIVTVPSGTYISAKARWKWARLCPSAIR